MHILIDSSLPNIEEAFPAPFIVTKYQSNDEVAELLTDQRILVCRSTLKINENLINNSEFSYILTASSGTDHIDKDYLESRNIQLIDARGSNAISVADYVLATLAALSEEGVSIGKKAGIIGLGAVGSNVLGYLQMLGYEIVCYDPPRGLRDNSFKSCCFEELFDCDLLCIHAELDHSLPYPSHNLINADFFQKMKAGMLIINAARGGIVNEHDLLNALIKPTYCTDVYLNEPFIDPEIVSLAKICTPHIAGHSLEAKNAAVYETSRKLHEALNLSIPESIKFIEPTLLKIDKNCWKKQVLSFYDPRKETRVLKEHAHVLNQFSNLRKTHNFRHNFCEAVRKEDGRSE